MTSENTGAAEAWASNLSEIERDFLGVLWGKSGVGRFKAEAKPPTVLIQHLLDTLSVGHLLWDEFLAPVVKARVDDIAGGNGRSFFAWLCGIHDLGKASPAFQSQNADLASAVLAAGLPVKTPKGRSQAWRHELGSGLILFEALSNAWADQENVAWVWPLAAGHHGKFWDATQVLKFTAGRKPHERSQFHGSGDAWGLAQRSLLKVVTQAAGFADLSELEPTGTPTRAGQLLISGFIVMADWIASNDELDGVPSLEQVSIEGARARARKAFERIRPGRGLKVTHVPSSVDTASRFGFEPRPLQSAMDRAARAIDAPGLIICEAPTGEGKTEAALAAAEILAARFGAEGVFIALPTQATSNAMFPRVEEWLAQLGSGLDLALVHGGRRMCENWIKLRDKSRRGLNPGDPSLHGEPQWDEDGLPVDDLDDLDCFSVEPSFASICEDGHDREEATVAAGEWFDGRNRGLLAHNAVGTIDQLLFAGTRTKHVMLRYAGLAGKVVIIDEVHAVDAYMATFLGEALAWLGMGRVPVILLSATLAPNQRRDLVECYLKGATGTPTVAAEWAGQIGKTSLVTSVWAAADGTRHEQVSPQSWRDAQSVAVEFVDSQDLESDIEGVADVLEQRLGDGGCALVIRNTVARAQQTYDRIVEAFSPDEVRLLHGRLASGDRAQVTDELIGKLAQSAPRPERLVIVATQVAEQSFDVDVDLLITDHAPIDLLIQRAGRMHRHQRDPGVRPQAVATPRVVITGIDRHGDVPWFAPGSEAIYGRHLLIRTAAVVTDAGANGGLSLPDAAPRLVAEVYGESDIVPPAWREVAAAAATEAAEKLKQSKANANQYLLVQKGEWSKKTLEGLHNYSGGTEDAVRVREGDLGAEVVLVVRDDQGYRTLGGDRLGVNGELATAAAAIDEARRLSRSVLLGAVRVPAAGPRGVRLREAVDRLGTLPEWRDHPQLRGLHVVVLDSDLRGTLGDFTVSYDHVRGLNLEAK